MQYSRRTFIGLLAAAAAAVVLPTIALSLERRRLPSLAEICAVCFDAVKAEMQDGKQWVSEKLQAATDKGYIRLASLGTVVDLSSCQQ